MIKIYVPKIEKYEVNKTQGEINHILKDGIILNESLRHIRNPKLAEASSETRKIC